MLVDKITGRIRSWSNRLLSYAGRIELVKSVLGGMKNYWAQIFCLPKKVIKKVEAICRTFVWHGSDSNSRKANVSWERSCLPISSGGLGLRNMVKWNDAAMLKHLWNLAMKKDSLWVRWVHSYYIKDKDISQTSIPLHASWSYKKIMKLRNLIDDWGNWVGQRHFSIKQVYFKLMGQVERVLWFPLMKSSASPRARFVMWLAAHNALHLKSKVRSWDPQVTLDCVLCDDGEETMDHLFVNCPNATRIRNRVFHFLKKGFEENTFTAWIATMAKIGKKKSKKARLITTTWVEYVYGIWSQRNQYLFNGTYLTDTTVARDIAFKTAVRSAS